MSDQAELQEPGITDDQVVKLLPALEEAARATQQTVERFVPPRVGIVEQALARRHQFILGRRGVGKSTLLRKVEHDANHSGAAVIFIDLETLRGNPYPDVLIQLMIELFERLEGKLKQNGSALSVERLKSRREARRLRAVRSDFQELLREPQSAEHTVRKLRSRSKDASADARVRIKTPDTPGADVSVGAGAGASAASSEERASEARFQRTKMEGLHASATEVRDALQAGMQRLADTTGYVALDEFHHIAFGDQPHVLAYLHQIVKNLEIYLKICGVRHRLNPFMEGDPPVGLQLGHDASTVSLDVTLEKFETAKRFLEQVLRGVCEPVGVDIDRLITETGQTRLVLASGGVARDYLNLTLTALRAANDREGSTYRPHNRITAEDVNEASTHISAQKQEDLLLDSAANAENLRNRLTKIAAFCLDKNQTNIFSVEGTKLRESDWGKEIQALADLRLVHEIGDLSIQTESYRGRPFRGFTLDLSTYTVTRAERIKQVPFWSSEGRQEIRRAALIYDPDTAEADSGIQREKLPPITEINGTLFDLPGSVTEDEIDA